jgi:predicted dehydrogenase
MASDVRLGVIGAGGMGRAHMRYFNAIPGLKFTAVADASPDNLKLTTDAHPNVKTFTDGNALIASGDVDAIFICTPHYFHPDLAIAGFKHNLHVLTEKPVAVTALAAEQVNKAHAANPKLVYAAMFQMRDVPIWKRIKSMIDSGQLGKLQRMSWIVTNWFRSQAYYDAGSWRATWKGEGGGVLLNQCPHNLDLICWLMGSPSMVHAHVALGKYHHIEVEDEVSAYLQWSNGMTGTFVTSTGEYPGTDRLEIIGDRGKLVVEQKGKILFINTHVNVSDFCKTTEEAFGTPPSDTVTIDIGGEDPGHKAVVANFIKAIQNPGTKLICPGEEGLWELELGNALLMSGLNKQPVPIPMDRAAYDAKLKDLIAKSTFKKGEVKKAKIDMDKSFH